MRPIDGDKILKEAYEVLEDGKNRKNLVLQSAAMAVINYVNDAPTLNITNQQHGSDIHLYEVTARINRNMRIYTAMCYVFASSEINAERTVSAYLNETGFITRVRLIPPDEGFIFGNGYGPNVMIEV